MSSCQGRDNVHMTSASSLLESSSPPLPWQHRLTQLGPQFFTRLHPTPVAAPAWAARNHGLAAQLGWPGDLLGDAHLPAFAGNALLGGSDPLATVYSGHQFGQWAGQLGDGRAIWLGEAMSLLGPQEIQLKGAGPTPYSRRGDGRAVLRSSIREYLCSEAMHGLGIPTTRALCLVASPEPVRRETLETAAVLTRTADPALGHVGFVVGSSADTLFLLGGNQSDAVTIARIAKSRLLGARWPATYPSRPQRLPTMRPGELLATTNEI